MITKNLIIGMFVCLAFNLIIISLYRVFGETAVLDAAFRIICGARIFAFFDQKDTKERGN